MIQQPKDYLTSENERNKAHGALFVKMIRKALGQNHDVLIGHHITFEKDGDLTTENEVPSADTLIFDHEIMKEIFGDKAIRIMKDLAGLPANERDVMLANYYHIFVEKPETNILRRERELMDRVF